MNKATETIQDKILFQALEDIPFDGLRWDVIIRAGEKVGYDADVVTSVFDQKIKSFLLCFSDWANRQMLENLQKIDTETLRIRDKVRVAVWERLKILNPYKDVVRTSLGFWLNPLYKPAAAKMLWQTADVIWDWAGDTSQDYNHYTKRGLLSGVLAATTLYWVNDRSPDNQNSAVFLERRIDNVLAFAKVTGRILKKDNIQPENSGTR